MTRVWLPKDTAGVSCRTFKIQKICFSETRWFWPKLGHHSWTIFTLVIFNWDQQRIPDMVIQSTENPMVIRMGKSSGFKTVIGDYVSKKPFFFDRVWCRAWNEESSIASKLGFSKGHSWKLGSADKLCLKMKHSAIQTRAGASTMDSSGTAATVQESYTLMADQNSSLVTSSQSCWIWMQGLWVSLKMASFSEKRLGLRSSSPVFSTQLLPLFTRKMRLRSTSQCLKTE